MTESRFDSGDLHELIRHAEGGDPIAQNLLGARLATGNGVIQDDIGSLYWYTEAIKHGYVHAKWNAGSMLVEGLPSFESYRPLGMKLIEEAAQANENSACLFLAQCYTNGLLGKAQDLAMASHWEQRAWDHTNSKEFDLGEQLPVDYCSALIRPSIRAS